MNYKDLKLPALPEFWSWEEGEDDGDPQAVRVQHGWKTTIYEAVACKYTEELVTHHRPMIDDRSSSPRGVPFSVYLAVHQALRQWYEVDG